MNTTASYWLTSYPHTVAALSGITAADDTAVSVNLAYIAGDHANMPDDDVIATYINENVDEVPL